MPVWIANQETLRGAEAFLGYCYRTWGDKPPARGPNLLRSRGRTWCRKHGLPVPQVVGAGVRKRWPAVFRSQVIEKFDSRSILGPEAADCARLPGDDIVQCAPIVIFEIESANSGGSFIGGWNSLRAGGMHVLSCEREDVDTPCPCH